jgi:hypothetical protein
MNVRIVNVSGGQLGPTYGPGGQIMLGILAVGAIADVTAPEAKQWATYTKPATGVVGGSPPTRPVVIVAYSGTTAQRPGGVLNPYLPDDGLGISKYLDTTLNKFVVPDSSSATGWRDPITGAAA